MANVEEFNKKVEVSIGAIVFLIASVYALTTIYNRFENVNKELNILREDFAKYQQQSGDWMLELDQRLLNVERCK